MKRLFVLTASLVALGDETKFLAVAQDGQAAHQRQLACRDYAYGPKGGRELGFRFAVTLLFPK